MIKILPLVLFLLLIDNSFIKGQNKTENMIIVTLDGYRWNEVFRGADKQLLNPGLNARKMKKTAALFWDNNTEVRRKLLMPFFWTEVVSKGTLYGNRDYSCRVSVANKYWFSYPGYHEILTGNPHVSINSNSLGPNPDITVLEQINQLPEFKDKVAVFSSWNAFNDIINEKRSRIFVNSCFSLIPHDLATPEQQNLEMMYDLMPRVIGNVRYDGLTFMQAFEYLKRCRPRVLMIALDETDEFGHSGQYEQYLQSAHRVDGLLEKLWTWIQTDSAYCNKTSLIITTDHGRGTGNGWKRHNTLTSHSDETWIAILGPDIESQGEIKSPGDYYNAQLAATIASLLEVPYTGNNPHYAQIYNMVNHKSDLITYKSNPKK
jgi:hypothetical protein